MTAASVHISCMRLTPVSIWALTAPFLKLNIRCRIELGRENLHGVVVVVVEVDLRARRVGAGRGDAEQRSYRARIQVLRRNDGARGRDLDEEIVAGIADDKVPVEELGGADRRVQWCA